MVTEADDDDCNCGGYFLSMIMRRMKESKMAMFVVTMTIGDDGDIADNKGSE